MGGRLQQVRLVGHNVVHVIRDKWVAEELRHVALGSDAGVPAETEGEEIVGIGGKAGGGDQLTNYLPQTIRMADDGADMDKITRWAVGNLLKKSRKKQPLDPFPEAVALIEQQRKQPGEVVRLQPEHGAALEEASESENCPKIKTEEKTNSKREQQSKSIMYNSNDGGCVVVRWCVTYLLFLF